MRSNTLVFRELARCGHFETASFTCRHAGTPFPCAVGLAPRLPISEWM